MNEEKEAIKYLEFLSNEKCECDACQSAKKKYKTILNLLDKQKKEIEKYKNVILNLNNNWISKEEIREKLNQINNEYSILLSNKSLSLERQNMIAQRHEAMRVVLEELLEEK